MITYMQATQNMADESMQKKMKNRNSRQNAAQKVRFSWNESRFHVQWTNRFKMEKKFLFYELPIQDGSDHLLLKLLKN